MAVTTLDAAGSNDSLNTLTYSVSTGTNRYLVFGAVISRVSGSPVNPTDVTYGGVSGTKINEDVDTAWGWSNWGWKSTQIDDSTSTVFSLSGQTRDFIVNMARSFQDVDQTTPFVNSTWTANPNTTASTGTSQVNAYVVQMRMERGSQPQSHTPDELTQRAADFDDAGSSAAHDINAFWNDGAITSTGYSAGGSTIGGEDGGEWHLALQNASSGVHGHWGMRAE